MEIAKLCRLCVTVKENMRPIEQDVLNQLKEFSEVNVVAIDGWPDKVCLDCVRDVSYCHEFKKCIEKSEQELRQLMDQLSKEPLSDEEIELTETDEDETIILSDSSDDLDQANCSCDEDESEDDDDTEEEDAIEGDKAENTIIFVDLTFDEVIEVEDHSKPKATSEELEEIGKVFIESSETSSDPKELNSNITLRRKCHTNRNSKVVTAPKTGLRFPRHLILHPLPSFIPFMEIALPVPISEPKKRERKRFVPKFVHRTSTHQDGLVPTLPIPTPIETFLESLDDKIVPTASCHPEALKFRTNFSENRDELVKILIAVYNEKVFKNSLIDIPFRWNKTLRRTGGRCWYRMRGGVRIVLVELSEKVLTSADRVRDTLIHELCHAAVWLLSKKKDSHGDYWKYWTTEANTNLPVLPTITRCHRYKIHYKYTYKCSVCNKSSMAHSKSKKIENSFCTRCHGPIEVFINERDKDGNITLIQPKKPSGFAKFVKDNYKLFKKDNDTYVQVMKTLSENYSKLTVAEKLKYRKSFGDMK